MTFCRRPGVTYLYVLEDPRTGEVRYVGVSKDPGNRFSCHVCDAITKGKHLYTSRWIRKLDRCGLRPTMRVIAVLQTESSAAAEIAYIARLRADGFRLTNATDGGEGTRGLSPETKEKIAASKRGKKRSPETVKKQSDAIRGRKHTEEAMKKIRADADRRRGIPRTPEVRAKISASQLGRRVSEETRKKLSAANLGKSPSAETRAKVSAALLGRKRSLEAVAKTAAALRGRTLSVEARQKLSDGRRRWAASYRAEQEDQCTNLRFW